MTNFNTESVEYVELYPAESSKSEVVPTITFSETSVPGQDTSAIYNDVVDSGTADAEDMNLQVPPWMGQSSPINSDSGDLLGEEVSTSGTSYGKKARRTRRSLSNQYNELSDDDKRMFVFNKVYKTLQKLDLDKEKMVTFLYSLGDAIASNEYPEPRQRQSRRSTKVDPQTIVQYIEQLSEEDRAELLAQIKTVI